jgi:hypothetical protein
VLTLFTLLTCEQAALIVLLTFVNKHVFLAPQIKTVVRNGFLR